MDMQDAILTRQEELEALLEAAEAEVERLRAIAVAATSRAGTALDENEKLQAENAQLRAVVDKLADINVKRNSEIERLREMLKRLAPVVFAHEEQKRTAMATNV
jgi:regulator of replication initiation timing